MKVSIIIPVIKINHYIRESVPEILKLKENIEIIILPNEKDSSVSWPKTRIIPTITSNPSLKRNLGVKEARGEIVAFLDDDAYPKKNWLKQALRHFTDANVIAVGGPAITPKSDSILQKASAAAFESFIGGGGTRNRYLSVGKTKEIDDWPSVNLLVHRHVFLNTGGFDPRYWPGEDTKLCLELLKYGKIVYEPNAVVYHHRRGSLIKHLRQIGNYGLHRGHFARLYPQNSLKLFYLLPSLFSLYLILGLLLLINFQFSIFPSINSGPLRGNFQSIYQFSIFNSQFITYYFIPLLLYFFLMFFDLILISLRYRNSLVGLATIPYIFFTHFYYGLRFIKGYFSPNISQSTHSKKTQ